MQTLIFTGNGGAGIALAAAATASRAAQEGRRTLLVSIGPSHSLGALFGEQFDDKPRQVAPNLEAWTIDVLGDMGRFWDQISGRSMANPTQTRVTGDELPLIPGSDLFLGLGRIRQQTANVAYDLLVVDAGPHDGLLRALAVPDGFRWFVRVMFGLDRGEGRSSASVSRAIVPVTLIPFEWVGQVQDARVQLELIRDETTNMRHTRVRYVLRPDSAAIDEARVAVPGLHMYGLAVDGLVVGPLLPTDIADARLADVVAHQQDVVAESARIWHNIPLLRLPVTGAVGSAAAMEALGAELAAHAPLINNDTLIPPIERGNGSAPFIAINLPGLRREALGLTLSGDELIVRAGPYRRHILLHEPLRGISNIKATREGDRLVVRPRG